MKYIIGFIVVLAVIFTGYTMLGGAPKVEAPANKDMGTAKTISNKVDKLAVPTPVEIPKPTNNNTIKNNQKDTMTTENQNITKATLKTNKGDITIEFYKEAAPKTVANFVKLASEGFYDGVKFHRVIKDFMIQGGDPLSKVENAAWGTGGPGYQFEDEIHANNRNNKYTLAMANSGPNTNGSQFFINTNDNNFLDTKHTVFGKVVAGIEVVDAIENTPTAAQDRPVNPMVIESIVLE